MRPRKGAGFEAVPVLSVLPVMALLACIAPSPGPAETLAVVNAHAYPLTDTASIDNATIVIRDGKIEAVAAGLSPPAGARVIQADGHIVTPGLMNAGTQLGLVEISAVADSSDATVTSGPLGAAFDIQYALNPNSTLLPLARADGITRAGAYPGGAANAPFAGMGAVLRLSEGAQILDTPQAMMFARVGGMAAAKAGGSRSAEWVLLRNALDEARQYGKKQRTPGPRDQLLNHLDAEALQPVISGRMPLAVVAARESDIREAARVADDYHLRIVLFGGAEAWRAAQLLAARRIPVVLDPFDDLPWTFDEMGARADNAAILQRAGVVIAFTLPPIHSSHNAGSELREAAGLAVAGGLPRIEALKALTAYPAAIWGIEGHYGTLAPGKDADLVIWDGDPLEPASAPVLVMVQGRTVSLETRQSLLRKRYAPAHHGDPWPPAYR